jgi:hypothetical protein
MIKSEIRERYLQDTLPIRLGGIAADLARVVSFSDSPRTARIVETMLEESRYFIEWTAPELSIDNAARLVEIQRELTRWRWMWAEAQNDPEARRQLAEQAQAWSDEILAMSGLLNE